MTMGYSFDYFAARLKCPKCGCISPDDDSTEMQTYIRDHPNAEALRVGTEIENLNDMEDKRYLLIEHSTKDQSSILEDWYCRNCGSFNWASIKIENGKITAIESVNLDGETFNASNYISADSWGEAADFLNKSSAELKKDDILPTLRKYLKSKPM
jgi:hypothetical protein